MFKGTRMDEEVDIKHNVNPNVDVVLMRVSMNSLIIDTPMVAPVESQ